jgi:hypothetical protein
MRLSSAASSTSKSDESNRAEESISEVAGAEDPSRAPQSNETAASEVDSEPTAATMALESHDGNPSKNTVASLRIVSSAAADATAPQNSAQKSATLTVAPPLSAEQDGAAATRLSLTAGVKDGVSKPASSPRFYFDRTHSAARHDAQQAAYVAKNGEAVKFAGGVSATGLSSGPEGAPAYSHHDNYSWVRGKLEYSSAARRWKLRYIPIDGQTDQYGGSMVLPNSPQLEQFRPGDMVTVEGAIGNSPAEHGSFSPLYELRAIKSQR